MNYKLANTVSEALQFLKEADGKGRIVAGGTDLILNMRAGRIQAETLVDISRIPELKTIKVENGNLIIGSTVTLNEVIKSKEVAQHAPVLVEAAGCAASMQVRNMGTLVGNVINANPEADPAMALAALGSSFIIQDINGEHTADVYAGRKVACPDMFCEINKTKVDSTKEIVTAVIIPCKAANEEAVYVRFALRKAMAPAILNSAISLKAENNKIVEARISMGPVCTCIKRASRAEAFLQGKELSKDVIKEAAELAQAEAVCMDNPFRGSAKYLNQVLGVLISRGIGEAAGKLGLAVK